ncbi:hypothetical protein JOB18_042277, partial [Solea senegalensis]
IGVYLHGICEDPRNFVVAESKDLNQIGEGLVGIIENSRCEWFDKDGKKRWGEWTALSGASLESEAWRSLIICSDRGNGRTV